MSVIYMYIGEFRNIFNMDITFDKDYDIQFFRNIKENQILGEAFEIRRSKRTSLNYGANINNIIGIIGENGAGKTSILELLSLTENDLKLNEATYFIVNKTESEGVFIIEGSTSNKNDLFSFLNRENLFIDSYKFCFEYNSIEKTVSNYVQELETSHIYRKSISLRYKSSIGKMNASSSEIFSNRINQEYTNNLSSSYRLLSKNKFSFLKSNYKNTFLNVKFKKSAFRYQFSRSVLNITNFDSRFDNERNYNIKDIYTLKTIDTIYEAFIERKVFGLLQHNYDIDQSELNKILIQNNSIWSKWHSDIQSVYDEAFKQFDIEHTSNLQTIVVKYLMEIASKYYEADLLHLKEEDNLVLILNKLVETLQSKLTHIEYNYEFINCWRQLFLKNNTKEVKLYKKYSSIDVKKHSKSIENFLNIYDLLNINRNNNSIDYLMRERIVIEPANLSDGERSLLAAISHIETDLAKYSNIERHINICLDEFEQFLHPEWCRQIISVLIELCSQYNNATFSIFIATHSPFIISDLYRQNVIILRLNELGESYVDNVSLKRTFGANIHSLYIDGMFLKSTNGEYSKVKIKEISSKLKKVIDEPNQCHFDMEKLQDIEWIVDEIGDDVVRTILRKLIDKLIKSEYRFDDISKLSYENKLELYKKLELEFKYAKNRD